MFYKRTRLFVLFNLLNFFHILGSLLTGRNNFLELLKKFLRVDNIMLTSFGRVALYDLIKLIIAQTNKRIFYIAPYTIPAVIHAITYAGGKVSYIDIDWKTGLIDENELEKKINTDSAGVIITHLYSNKDHIQNFIKKFDNRIKIIEDAAINFGAKINNKHLGTLADFGFFSFAMVKNLNTFTGGAIYIKEKKFFDEYTQNRKAIKFPLLKTFELLLTAIFIKIFFNNYFYQITHYVLNFVYSRKINFILKRIYPVLFHKLEKKTPKSYHYDFNWTMDRVAVYNLQNINNEISKRILKAKAYKELLNSDVVIKTDCLNGENALLEYPIFLKNISNKQAHKILMAKGYDIRHTWYINNIKEEINFNREDFKNSFYLEEKIFCLPLHKNINYDDIKKISKIINNFT